MKRFTAVAAFAALCSNATGANAAPVLHARNLASATAWAATATQSMPLRQNVTLLGALPASAPLHIGVGLTMPNRAAADAYLARITTKGDPLYGRYLTPAQFAATFAPSAASANAVARYLNAAGLSNVRVAPNHLLITADGSAATVGRAFNTTENVYRVNGTTFFANATAAQVPAALGNAVLAVTGLSNLDAAHTNLHYRSAALARTASLRARAFASTRHASDAIPGETYYCFAGVAPNGVGLPDFGQGALGVPTSLSLPVSIPFGPDDCLLATLNPTIYRPYYGADGTPTGGNTDLAIIAEGKLDALAGDLAQFWGDHKITPSLVSIIPTDPVGSLTDTAGIGEFDMDTEYSTSMAQGVHHLYVYDGAALNTTNLANETNQWVTDDLAKTASESIGGCEFLSYATGATLVEDEILLNGALQGQTLFVSTGDEGSACAVVANTGTPVGIQSVEFPASSSYTVAVGGTSLVPKTDLSYEYEFSWIGGGGGISYVEGPGPWQTASDVPSALAGRRGVPDIAAIADANFGGAWVYTAGKYNAIGGTSLATPVSAGLWSRIQSANGNRLGFGPPLIYRAFRAQNALSGIYFPTDIPPLTSHLFGGLRDIYAGNNGLYNATLGWDYNTGVGALNVAGMNALLTSL